MGGKFYLQKMFYGLEFWETIFSTLNRKVSDKEGIINCTSALSPKGSRWTLIFACNGTCTIYSDGRKLYTKEWSLEVHQLVVSQVSKAEARETYVPTSNNLIPICLYVIIFVFVRGHAMAAMASDTDRVNFFCLSRRNVVRQDEKRHVVGLVLVWFI